MMQLASGNQRNWLKDAESFIKASELERVGHETPMAGRSSFSIGERAKVWGTGAENDQIPMWSLERSMLQENRMHQQFNFSGEIARVQLVGTLPRSSIYNILQLRCLKCVLVP